MALQDFCVATCGVFFKVLKDRVAAQVQTALGFIWDSRTLTRTLEEKRLLSYSEEILELAGRKTLSVTA